MADSEAVATAEVVETSKAEPAKQEAVARPKPSLETFTGVDWTKFKDEEKTALQAEIDRRFNVARENASRRARKEAEAFYKGRESVRPAEQPKAAEKPKEAEAPTREQFQSYEEFLEAKAVFVAEKAARTAHEKVSKEANEKVASEAQAKRAIEFQSKVRAKFPDIDSRLEEIGDQPIHKGVQEAIAESQFGPEILNDLVSKPQEFDRLYKLSETAAIREIGRIEARIEAALTSPAANTLAEPVKKPSAAPAPIKPGGGGSPEDGTPKDSDDINDWMRKERARQRKKTA